MMFTRFAALSAIAVVLSGASFAAAQVNVPSSARAGDVPLLPGFGLAGLGWTSDQSTADSAEQYALVNAPDFTFQSTRINYPNGPAGSFSDDNNTVATFLGQDAATLSGSGDHPIDGTFYRFVGFIAIADISAPITFGVFSDDGFRLRIGGVVVTEFNDPRGPSLSTGQAIFEQAGLYPIDLIYFETAGGEAGVNLLSSLAGPARLDRVADINLVEPANLYVPSPGSVGLALLGVVLIARRGR